MRDEIANSFGRILAQSCTPDVVRAIESGSDHRPLWRMLEETGFADALVPEEAGGAGLSLIDTVVIAELCGRYTVPLPFAETMVIRGILAQAGLPVPDGSITFGRNARRNPDGSFSAQVTCGRVSDWALISTDGEWRVLPIETAERSDASFVLDAALRWQKADVEAKPGALSVNLAQAFVHSAQLSGALIAVFEKTLSFANDRQQFGRPIGKFQAIQHQLSVIAEHVFAARMSVDVAASHGNLSFDCIKIAIAKARTSEAAAATAALSHSIHGAIGFTEEYDLQLLIRRLHTWRQSAGSEGYWTSFIGSMLIKEKDGKILDFLRRASDIA